MKRLLIIAISCLALTACLKDFRQAVPEQHMVYKDRPTGQGDPSDISCYRPPMSFAHVSTLECKPNSEWAVITANYNRAGPVDIGNNAAGATVNVVHH